MNSAEPAPPGPASGGAEPAEPTGYLVGIDVGGTFTDVCVAAPDGRLAVHKTPTSPDIVTGVVDGVRRAAEAAGLDEAAFLARVDRFGHGSTVAVNAVLERRLARTGLVTTRGFGDTLWIARMMAMTTGLPPERWTDYRQRRRPDPPVERRCVREVDERVDYRGAVLAPLDAGRARAAIEDLVAEGIEALAICTLWSFRNPAHERLLASLAAEAAPGLYVSASCDVAPVIKEYERMATTTVNAALGPVVRAYVTALAAELRDRGLRRDLYLLNSVGGVIPPEEAVATPVQLLGSGPSGGVLAARRLAARMGIADAITADMGGTSFDVGLIVGGEPLLAGEAVVGNLNLLTPALDIRSIGAGGGSIAAAVDGGLRVGPRSAGSVPGPACYGRGGQAPTTTDADLVLGYLDAGGFLGGRMRLDPQAAAEAIRGAVAEPLGLSVEDAAAGIREVADQQMADLLRQTTVERGHDPRGFTLFAYGGAGPLHAAAFAPPAGLRRIVVPPVATAFSAFGILGADLRLSRQRSVLQRTRGEGRSRAEGLDGVALDAELADLEAEAAAALARWGLPGGDGAVLLRTLRMRYARQVHELAVPVTAPCGAPGGVERLVADFERLYAARYGPAAGPRHAVIEVTTCLVQLIRSLPQPVPAVSRPLAPAAPAGRRRVYLGPARGWCEVPVWDRADLGPGSRLDGPALVDAEGTTVWVAAGHRAEVGDLGEMLLEARA